jgi:26S proteasome regulatory subunit N5
MVVSKAIAARIDRPAAVICFGKQKQPEELLNNWSNNISKLLGLVEKATQQIAKESMLNKVQLTAN